MKTARKARRRPSIRKRTESFAGRIGETPSSLSEAGSAVRAWLKSDGRQTREGGRRPSEHEVEEVQESLVPEAIIPHLSDEVNPSPISPVKTGGPLPGNKETQEHGRSVTNGRSTPRSGVLEYVVGNTGNAFGRPVPGNGAGRRSRRQTETRREFARVLAETSPACADRAEPPEAGRRPEAQPTSRSIQPGDRQRN